AVFASYVLSLRTKVASMRSTPAISAWILRVSSSDAAWALATAPLSRSAAATSLAQCTVASAGDPLETEAVRGMMEALVPSNAVTSARVAGRIHRVMGHLLRCPDRSARRDGYALRATLRSGPFHDESGAPVRERSAFCVPDVRAAAPVKARPDSFQWAAS